MLQQSILYATKVTELHSLMTERFGSQAKPGSGEAMNGVEAYYPDRDVFLIFFNGETWIMPRKYRGFMDVAK